MRMEILLKQLTHDNYADALAINRDDLPKEWVDTASSIMKLTYFGAERNLFRAGFSCDSSRQT